jgi:hypothetical protein
MEYNDIIKSVDEGDVESLLKVKDSKAVHDDTYGYFLLRFNDAMYPTSEVMRLVEAGYPTSLLMSRLISYQAASLIEEMIVSCGAKLDGYNLSRAYDISDKSDILIRVIDKYTTKEALDHYESLKYDHTGEELYSKYLKDICKYCEHSDCECEDVFDDDNELYKRYGLTEFIEEDFYDQEEFDLSIDDYIDPRFDVGCYCGDCTH